MKCCSIIKSICFCFFFLLFMPFCILNASDMSEDKKLSEENTKRLDYLEELLDEVERATLVDRISLSADVRVTMNNYLYRELSPDENINYGFIRENGETIGAWNIRGRIKMSSMLGDSFKLTAWLSMYKQFLESSPDRYNSVSITPYYDASRGQYPSDSRVYMERLYVDWFITEWLAFSAGRSSTVGGPPSEIRYDSVRLGTFAESIISSPLDGVYFAFDLDTIFGMKNSIFRLYYVPRLFMHDVDIPNNLFVSSKNPLQFVYGGQLDMEIPGLRNSNFMLQIAHLPELKGSNPDIDIDGDGQPDEFFVSYSMGNVIMLNTNFTAPRIFSLPLDVYAAFNYIVVKTPLRNEKNPDKGFIGISDEDGNKTPLFSLLGNNLSGSLLHGFMGYGGVRYNFPFTVNHISPKLGVDFNYGSPNHYSFHSPDTTGLNRFAVRGVHGEVYGIIPVHRKANIRLCYVYQRHFHTPDLFLPVGKNRSNVPEVDEIIHNWNIMLNVYF